MEQNNFYFILSSRGDGKTRAQCDALERAYEEICKKKRAEREVVEKIIKTYTDELVELRKTMQNKIQQLKGQATTTKKESITRWAYMDVLSLASIQLGSMQDRIERKIENILEDYGKEN